MSSSNPGASGTSMGDGFDTYEDYLDSFVTEKDLFYLEDEEVARGLVELGFRGTGDALNKHDFDARKQVIEEKGQSLFSSFHESQTQASLASLHDQPLLQAIAEREEPIRSGTLSCILFVRALNGRRQEVSGFIDLGHKLRTEEMDSYFQGKRKVLPKPTDLSYFNWETQAASSNSSPNFQVLLESEEGILFKNKRDRKTLNVDPFATDVGDNSSKTEIEDPLYKQVILFDHMMRRKT